MDLHILQPLGASLGLALCLTGLVLWFPGRLREIKDDGPLVAVALLGILGVAAWVRFGLVTECHRVFTDEALYMKAASGLLRGDLGPGAYEKTWGWPATLALAFGLGGRSLETAFFTTKLLGVFAVLLTYVAGRSLTGRASMGLWAALLLAVLPAHARWSATVEANVPGTLALLLLLSAWLSWRKTRGRAAGILVAGAFAWAASTRVEIWSLAPLLLWDVRSWARGWVPIAAGAVLALPDLVAGAALHGGVNLGRAEAVGFREAVLRPLELLTCDAGFAWILVPAAILGLVLLRRRDPGATRFLGVAAALLLLAVLLSGAGALARPARILLAPGVPLVLLAAAGIDQLTGLLHARSRVGGGALALVLAVGMIAAAMPGLDRAAAPEPTLELQTHLPARVSAAVPEGCVLVAALPELYDALHDLPVQRAASFDPDSQACAWFVWDMACSRWRDSAYQVQCRRMAALADRSRRVVFREDGAVGSSATLFPLVLGRDR